MSPQDLYPFFLRSFLLARIDLGQESGECALDQDMNVYLAQLLLGSYSGFSGFVYQPLINLDCHILQSRHFSTAEKARLWRRLGDSRTLADGVMWLEDDNHSSSKTLRPENVSGAMCYSQAVAYTQNMHQTRHLRLLLEALALYYQKNIKLLRHVSAEYLNFLPKCSESEIANSLFTGEQQHSLEVFLELLSQWRQTPTEELRLQLIAAAKKACIEDVRYH